MSRPARTGVPVRTGSVDPHPYLPIAGAPATGFPTGLTGAAVAVALPLASALFLAFAVPARRLRSHSTGEAFSVPQPPDRSRGGGDR